MTKRIRFPHEELIIEGAPVSEELVLGSHELDELEIDGSILTQELVLDAGVSDVLPGPVFLISRNADEQLISRVGDYPLISRRL